MLKWQRLLKLYKRVCIDTIWIKIRQSELFRTRLDIFCKTLLFFIEVLCVLCECHKMYFVLLQDFTLLSDIDRNKSILEIDNQLYAKYNLTNEEIDFIERSIKSM